MEDDKNCEVSHLILNFHLNFFWLIHLNQKLMQFKIKRKLYYITYNINIPINP
jgi:hypothetical protein